MSTFLKKKRKEKEVANRAKNGRPPLVFFLEDQNEAWSSQLETSCNMRSSLHICQNILDIPNTHKFSLSQFVHGQRRLQIRIKLTHLLNPYIEGEINKEKEALTTD